MANSTESRTYVTEQISNEAFGFRIPNILFELRLSPGAIALYCYYKRIAGQFSTCWKSNKTIQEEINMSKNTLLKYREELEKSHDLLKGKPLIYAEERFTNRGDNDTTEISIIDIWQENGDFYRGMEEIKKSYGGGSKSERGVVQNLNGGGSKFEHKEYSFKSNPYKENKIRGCGNVENSSSFQHNAQTPELDPFAQSEGEDDFTQQEKISIMKSWSEIRITTGNLRRLAKLPWRELVFCREKTLESNPKTPEAYFVSLIKGKAYTKHLNCQENRQTALKAVQEGKLRSGKLLKTVFKTDANSKETGIDLRIAPNEFKHILQKNIDGQKETR